MPLGLDILSEDLSNISRSELFACRYWGSVLERERIDTRKLSVWEASVLAR